MHHQNYGRHASSACRKAKYQPKRRCASLDEWKGDYPAAVFSVFATEWLGTSFRDGNEVVGLQAGAPDERPVDIRQRKQLAGIRRLDRSFQLGQSFAEEFESLRERSEEHTSELQSLMRISYAVFCLKKKTKHNS